MRAGWKLAGVLSVFASAMLACMGGDEPAPAEPAAEAPPPSDGKAAKRQARKERREAAKEAGGGEGAGSTASSSGDAAPPASSGDGDGSGPNSIEALGNNTWSIKRNQIRKWEDAPLRFAKADQKDGGIKIKQVSDRMGRHVGLKDGDFVLSINGMKLRNSVESATTYSSVRNKSTLTVKLKRSGSTKTLTYKVVD